jgi:hypothetical protein
VFRQDEVEVSASLDGCVTFSECLLIVRDWSEGLGGGKFLQEQQTALQRRGELKSVCCTDVITTISVAVCTPSASWLSCNILWNVGTGKI